MALLAASLTGFPTFSLTTLPKPLGYLKKKVIVKLKEIIENRQVKLAYLISLLELLDLLDDAGFRVGDGVRGRGILARFIFGGIASWELIIFFTI